MIMMKTSWYVLGVADTILHFTVPQDVFSSVSLKKNAVSKDKSKESASADKKDGHQKKFKALYCDLISYLTAV